MSVTPGRTPQNSNRAAYTPVVTPKASPKAKALTTPRRFVDCCTPRDNPDHSDLILDKPFKSLPPPCSSMSMSSIRTPPGVRTRSLDGPNFTTPRLASARSGRATPRPDTFGGDSHIDPDLLFAKLQWIPNTPKGSARTPRETAAYNTSVIKEPLTEPSPENPSVSPLSRTASPRLLKDKEQLQASSTRLEDVFELEIDKGDGKDVSNFNLDDFHRGVCVRGVGPEDTNMYPKVVQLASGGFITKFVAMATFLPVLMNSAWMMLGNIVNDGHGLQNLYYFVFFFDTYFMLLKGTMISAYFAVFMPPTVKKLKVWMHVILVLLFPAVSISIHVLWIGLDTIHTTENWILMKLNFPAGASVSLVVWMLPYLFVSFAKGERFFAFKRYFILVIVLVGDLFFIATSHIFVYYFFEYQKGRLFDKPESWWLQRVIEFLWVSTFSLVYMPLLGKIWQFAIFLFDKFAPMKDLQRQRLFCFATVILDAHRIMYVREIFTGLKGYEVFALVVMKDWIVDVFQFGFRSLPTIPAAHLIRTDLKNQKLIRRDQEWRRHSTNSSSNAMTTLAFIADLLENPLAFFHRFRTVLAVFHWRIDGCYGGEDKTQLSEKPLRFFFGDAVIWLKNMPSLAVLDDTNPEIFQVQRKRLMTDWKSLVIDSSMKSVPERPRKRFQIFEQPDISLKEGSSWDKFHAIAFSQLPCKDNTIKEFTQGKLADASCVDFYRPITMQISSLIYTRWKIRGAIRLSSALMFLFTGFLIRESPSGQVMNKIMDHSVSMPTRLWIFGIVFVTTDLVKELIIQRCQNCDNVAKAFNMRHFARLFADQVFAGMILSCLVCCNSDLFLTFPELEFGK